MKVFLLTDLEGITGVDSTKFVQGTAEGLVDTFNTMLKN